MLVLHRPAVRGRELYRPLETVLAEARGKAALGAKEITLLGQTVNSYHVLDGNRQVRFPELLRRVGEINEIKRIRFESPHPHFLDDDLIAAMAQTPSVCEQMHLPAQSGSDRLLKIMRRGYDAAELLDKAARLRAALPRVEVHGHYRRIPVGERWRPRAHFEAVAALRPSWSYI